MTLDVENLFENLRLILFLIYLSLFNINLTYFHAGLDIN